MNRNLVYGLAFLSLLLVCSTALTPSTAADYMKVGVKQGDRATYSVAEIDANVTIPVTTATLYVQNITTPLVTLYVTLYYSDGSVCNTGFETRNIASGGFQDYSPLLMPFLTAAGLAPGDPPSLWTTCTINESTQMTVAGYNRTVNFFNNGITFVATPVPVPGVYVFWTDMQYYYWWDKATGLLVKFMFHETEKLYNVTESGQSFSVNFTGLLVSSYNWTLVSTTAFSGAVGSDSTMFLVIGEGVAVGVVGIAGGYLLGRRGRRR